MNIELLELAATTLDEVLDDIVFLGGATVTLWITDPTAPPARATDDIDFVVEVVNLRQFYKFEKRLRGLGFVEDQDSGVICRWRHRQTGLLIDALPMDPSILGFDGKWAGIAFGHAVERKLPSGATIQAIPPPYLLATKIEAFGDRGNEDFLASVDFEDIIVLVDGREELVDEVLAADTEVRAYIASELRQLMEHPRFPDGLAAALRPDAESQARSQTVIEPRLNAMAADV
jgi:hypothetical protein